MSEQALVQDRSESGQDASIAGLLLTTEALVVEKKEETEDEGHGGHGHGHSH